jgi:hypothetical protein
MSEGLEGITREEFEKYRDIRYGRSNPERMDNPLWLAMVRHRFSGFSASQHYHAKVDLDNKHPIWCFSRSGMSRTLLEDDSVVCIGGVHEYSGDPDFAIYNDVIIRHWDGTIEIYGYPIDDFEPTDFHTATLVNQAESIYIIGGIGRPCDRVFGTTPVYQLSVRFKTIQRLKVPGIEPGWISKHEARYVTASQEILVWGGEIQTSDDHTARNFDILAFSIVSNTWRKVERPTELRYAYEDPAVASLNPSIEEVALVEEYALMKRQSPNVTVGDAIDMLEHVRRYTFDRTPTRWEFGWSWLRRILIVLWLLAVVGRLIWQWVTGTP